MARSKPEMALPWMIDLANKYEVSPEVVLDFFNSISYDSVRQITKRKRTEEFFELYFEGVKEDY